MRELYPIGTKLITKRLSQISLYVELFGDEHVISCLIDDKGAVLTKVFGNDPLKDKGFYPDADWWEVYDEKNLKWLSPVPLFEDLVDVDRNFEINPFYISRYFGDYFKEQRIDPITLKEHLPFWLSAINPETYKRIIERTYPNNQRAPLIEWDEVILPEQKG